MSTRNLVFLLFFSLFFTKNSLLAQCPITVSAGPDVLVCNTGDISTLNGSIGGPTLGFVWSPPTGLSNPNVLNPSVTVTGPATYTLSAQAVDPSAANLVTNPGFEAGNTGFTSQYTYNPTPITPGTYVLTTSPALVLASFPPCDDHTYGNGTGNMMLINGNASTGAQVWCQTINVTQNTWYVMSGWVMASPITPPTMQFSVNGVAVGDPYPVGTGTCNWQQFSASWYSGSATSAQLCILDQITGGNGFFGDDYALDDIFFAAACTVTDEVNVDVANIEAVVPITAFLPCNAAQSGIQLDGSASSSGPNITYLWTGPGVIGGATTTIATVNQVGNYTLTVTLNIGPTNCQVSESLDVLDDPNIVTATATANDDLTCASPTVMLDGTGTSTGTTISYDWEPAFAVVSGQGTLMPEVNQSGLYTLTVTNSISGCTATATAFVNQNTTLPAAAASAPDPLSCAETEVTLSGNNSSTGPDFSYLWVGPGIVSGDDLLNNCVVNIPGQYTLTVTNDVNGCTSTATANVLQGATVPTAVANANAPGSLDCETPTLTLNSTGSSTGAGITYAWSTTNGHFTSPTNGPTATVDEGGTYFLTVTNSIGCTAIASVGVTADFAQPNIGIATPVPAFLCNTDSVMLDASQSSGGGGFDLVWASQNGTFLSGETTLMPWVGSAGTYTLTITNTANGCSASASATVTADTTPPIAQAGPNATLDCDGTAINLNGNGSSTGPNFTYQWTTNGGNIVSGDTTLTPQVNGVGNYFLTVENGVNGCTAVDSVAVEQDLGAPIVIIAPPGQLDCNNNVVTVDASASDAHGGIGLSWYFTPASGGTGNPILFAPYVINVSQPGTYSLTLLNAFNNCEATASVVVLMDTLPPVADAGTAPILDCSAQSGTLDGSGSSQGPSFSYQWSSGDTTLSPTISAAGIYMLTVTNDGNGCTATDSVTVAAFGNLPTVVIAAPDNLDCTQTEIQLAATASAGSEFDYNWTFTGTGVGLVSGDTTLSPTVGSPGSYTLTVTNTVTSCTASESVQVVQLANVPIVAVNGSQTLFCGQTSIQLNGVGTSPNGVSYAWTTQNGNILSGEATPNLTINAPGIYTLTVTDLQSGCTASDDVLVGQDATAPLADAGAPQSLTCSVLSVTLDGTGSSTGPGISYLWTTTDGTILMGETTLTPAVTAIGTYLLTVTDANNNCQTLASVQVFDLSQQPDAIVAAPQSLGCNVATVTLDGTGSSTGVDFVYLWTGPGIVSGATTLMPAVNVPGVYTFTVTNLATDCSTVAQVTVIGDSTPPVAVAAAPQSLNCIAQQVVLSGMGSSTGAGFSYLWSGPGIVSGGTTLMPTVDAPGDYILTVSNQANGCTATASTTVNQTATPPTVIAAAPQSLNCITLQVTLDGTGSSIGTGFSYLWSGPGIVSGGTTLTPTVDAPGDYILTVSNQANGCTATASTTVNQTATPPTVDAGPGATLDCDTDQVELHASTSANTSSQFWTFVPDPGVVGEGIVSGPLSFAPWVNLPGTYVLTVTDLATGCTATASAIVGDDTTPPTAVALAVNALSCNSFQADLVGTGSDTGSVFAYLWTGPGIVSGGTSLSLIVDAPGEYTLTVTNQINGCTAMATDSVIQYNDAPIAVAQVPQMLDCTHSEVTLSGAGSTWMFEIIYFWTGPGVIAYDYSLSPVVNEPGVYTLTVETVFGCTATAQVTVSHAAELVVVLAPTVSVVEGGSIQLNPSLNIPLDQIASVNWSPAEGLDCTDCLSPTVTATSNITYTVTVTSTDGCTASASITITVTAPEGNIYVPNAFSPNDDGINDVLVVFADEQQVKQVVSFQVFTRWGESVYEGFGLQPNDFNTGWDGTFRDKKVDTGVYAWFAEVELVNGERKVVKGDVVVVR